MILELLAKVCTSAVNGYLKAAKVYFDVMGCLKTKGEGNTFINNQLLIISKMYFLFRHLERAW